MSKEYIEKEAAQLYAKNIREYLNELYNDGWITITDIDWRVLMSLILAINDIPPADVKCPNCGADMRKEGKR